ncbi:conserved exported protein of unknown function [Tenacibaculum sp. 190524A02b]|uniref:DUF4252 domain-containing protein n=1 Tax=Tenacibaculum vairaonense TaxID=3137860 RepID=UPI0032B1892E
MRSILFILCSFFFFQVNAQEQNFKNFYKSNKDRAAISLNLPGFTSNFFASNDELEELEVFLKKAKNYKVMIFDSEAQSTAKDFNKFIRKNDYKTLVRIKDRGDRVRVYFRETADLIREIVISTSTDNDGLVLLGVKTKLTKDELAALVKSAQTSIASN